MRADGCRAAAEDIYMYIYNASAILCNSSKPTFQENASCVAGMGKERR